VQAVPCVIGLGGAMLNALFLAKNNDTALLRQLGVPGEPQTAAQAAASLYHSTAGSIAHAGEACLVFGVFCCGVRNFVECRAVFVCDWPCWCHLLACSLPSIT
jgi:hypothetical protein